MLAASYPEVERIFVNPAIKKKLCDTWTGDRSALGKVRPIYGHDAHFHIRIKCPHGAKGLPTAGGRSGPADGCDKSLAWWFTDEPWAKPKKDPNAQAAEAARGRCSSPTCRRPAPPYCRRPAARQRIGGHLRRRCRARLRPGRRMPANQNDAVPAISAQMPPNLPDVVPIPLPRPAGY